MRYLFLLYFSLGCVTAIQSQHVEFGIIGGLTLYEGELSPKNPDHFRNFMRPNWGGSMKINLFRWMSFQLSAQRMELYADGAYALRHNNLEVSMQITEYSWQAIFYPLRWHPFQHHFSVSPFIAGGTTFFNFTTYGKYEGQWLELRPLGTEGQGMPGHAGVYDNWALALPLRLGIRLQLNRNWAFVADLLLRYTFTDYLDDITFAKVNYQEILKEKGAQTAFFTGSYFSNNASEIPKIHRRGSKRMDYYHSFSISLHYRIGQPVFLGEKKRRHCWELRH